MSKKYDEARIKYAPQIEQLKRKAEDARLKYKGYYVEKIEDPSVTGFITEFEHYLPLKKIDIDDN